MAPDEGRVRVSDCFRAYLKDNRFAVACVGGVAYVTGVEGVAEDGAGFKYYSLKPSYLIWLN